MDLLIPIKPTVFSLLTDSFLLIDSNFIIDAYRFTEEFNTLINKISDVNCTLFSIDAIKYEFTKGSKSIVEHQKKLKYYSSIIKATLLVDKNIHNNQQIILNTLLSRSKDLSYPDSLLLGTLMKYDNNKTFLLTRDRTDIPIDIFPIKASIALYAEGKNIFYSIYSFNKQLFEDNMKRGMGKK